MSVPSAVAMSFREVTKYWLKKPVVVGPTTDAYIVNGTVWKNLSDDLKAIVEGATETGSARNDFMDQVETSVAWKFGEDYVRE